MHTASSLGVVMIPLLLAPTSMEVAITEEGVYFFRNLFSLDPFHEI